MIEVLIAVGVSVMLLVVAWDMFLSGKRGLVRGEAKLDYMAEANTTFLAIERDLHASVAEPELVSNRVLVVRRYQLGVASSGVATQAISYARAEGADPNDVALERRVTSGLLPDEEREKRLCRGTLSDFRVAVKELAGVRAVEVVLAFHGAQDTADTRFARLFVAGRPERDETWIPLKK